MFVVWLISICLYWSGLPYIAISFIFFSALYSAYRYSTLNNKLIFSSIFIGISFTFGLLFSSNYPESHGPLVSAFHMFLLLLFFSIIRPKFDTKSFSRFLVIFSFITFFSLLVTIIYHIEGLVFFTSQRQFRYEFIFLEPSYLGIYCCVLLAAFFFLMDSWDKFSYTSAIFLSIIIFYTGSGSAIFLLFSIFALFVISKYSLKNISVYAHAKFQFKWVFLALSLLVIALILWHDQITTYDFIVRRLSRIASGNFDASTYMRFIAPLEVSKNIIEQSPFFGAGFGFGEEYLRNNYQIFSYLMKYDKYGYQIINLNIDNVYVSMLVQGGILGVFWMIVMFIFTYRNYEHRSKRFYILILLSFFFSGALIHPLFTGFLFSRK